MFEMKYYNYNSSFLPYNITKKKNCAVVLLVDQCCKIINYA